MIPFDASLIKQVMHFWNEVCQLKQFMPLGILLNDPSRGDHPMFLAVTDLDAEEVVKRLCFVADQVRKNKGVRIDLTPEGGAQ